MIDYASDSSVFRKAEEGDIGGIQKLYEDLLRSTGRQGSATYEERLKCFQKNSEIFYIVEQENILVGYLGMLPLLKESLDRIMPSSSKTAEMAKITVEDVVNLQPGEIDNLFLIMEVRQNLSRSKQYAARLINEGIEVLENLARRGVFVKNLYATSSTPDGIRICRGIGFTETQSPVFPDLLYFRLNLETSEVSFIKRYQEIVAALKQARLSSYS